MEERLSVRYGCRWFEHESWQWLEIFAKVGSKYSQVKLNLKYCPRLLQFYQSSEIWPNLVTLIRVLRDGYEEDKSQ